MFARSREISGDPPRLGNSTDRRRFLQSSVDHAVRLSMTFWPDEMQSEPAATIND